MRHCALTHRRCFRVPLMPFTPTPTPSALPTPSWVSDVDWGNVPARVGGVLTGGSLLLGFYTLLRDRRKRSRIRFCNSS